MNNGVFEDVYIGEVEQLQGLNGIRFIRGRVSL